jgi:hypothetical protein
VKRTLPAFLIAALIVGACAQRPEEIKATTVSDVTYRGMNCQQLRAEYDKANLALFDPAKSQHLRAEKDAFSVFMVGVPASPFAANQDFAPTIAGLKGQLEAIAAVGKQKNCPPMPKMASDLPFQDLPPDQIRPD